MFTTLINWLDHRAGIRSLLSAMLLEGIPGGARWRYVWGSCLAFVFSIQLITGIMLMTAYSPSASQAWNSVHAIQYKMDFGWLIRGLHHFGSQTMMVLIALHMLQVVIAGAHLPPRELNWWLGIGLLSVTLGLSLTGYLLPWDQKGYWATMVATNIAGTLPEIGEEVRHQAVGGPDYGNYTLTRFYALHVAILPLTLIGMLVAHVAIFRRHGVTSTENKQGLVSNPENEHAKGTEPFWPRQAFYDMLACMVVFGIMLGMVLYGFAHKVTPPPHEDGSEPNLYEKIARYGVEGKGAELDASADRNTANYPARPEWYFLFLFQLLKYFPGDYAIWGTVIIPNGVMMILFLLPLLGFGPVRKLGHFVGIVFLTVLFVMVGLLTLKALDDDQPEGILGGIMKTGDEETRKKEKEKAEKFQHDVHEAEIKAKRACQLAMGGTHVEGGHVLLRNDPYTTGNLLFQGKCGSCHNFSAGKDDKFESWKGGKSASDLGDYASFEWIHELLKNPGKDTHLGLVKLRVLDDDKKPKVDAKGDFILAPAKGMINWRKGIDDAQARWRESEDADVKKKVAQQNDELEVIAKWLADQRHPKDKRNKELAKQGQAAFELGRNKCKNCHVLEGTNGAGEDAPDLTGYGSTEWIRSMIMRPMHGSRYGEKNNMPAFRDQEAPGALKEFRDLNPTVTDKQIQFLTDVERELIIRWMIRDYRPVFGGAPIR